MIAELTIDQENRHTKVLKISERDIDQNSFKDIIFNEQKTMLVIGFISPHLDFKSIANKIQILLPSETKLILSSSAGELCSLSQQSGGKLYHETTQSWDNIVLESFSASMIEKLFISTIQLAPSNMEDTNKIITTIESNIKKIEIPFRIDHHDTLAFTLIDGLSAQESFFMEAVYNSGKFPCLLVGGSAGGKLDFQNTYIYDGSKVVQNCAVVALIKLQKNVQYGVFKSQNFKPTTKSFILVEANPKKRYVSSVLNQENLYIESFIDSLASHFQCTKEQLNEKFVDYTFAIKINNEYFIRSISVIDFENDIINFYCDVTSGDELILMKKNDFITQTNSDFKEFMQNKSNKVIGAILNDCILRRLNNSQEIEMIKTFENIPLVGFSTFGELLGVNINQTLTSIFFFEKDDSLFKDYYVDNFVSHYSNFKNYFVRRQKNQLHLILKIKNELLEKVTTSVPLIVQTLNAIKSTIINSSDVENQVSDILNNMQKYMDKINSSAEDTKDIFEKISHIQDDIKRIRKSTDSSDDITKQTRILALNASVEAAKAGVHGLRFSVISTELERLSKDTKDKINTTVNAVDCMYSRVTNTKEKMEKSSSQLKEVIDNSSIITKNMQNISTIVKDTSKNLKAELSSTEKLLEDIEIISQFQTKIQKVDNII
jgi:hypothetical protein